MKFLSILAAASLALAPAVAAAGSGEKGTDQGRPIAGPTAVKPLDDDKLPAAALFAGGVFIFAGAIFALSGGDDDAISSTQGTTE